MTAVVVETAIAPRATASPRFLRRLLRRPLAIVCLTYLALVLGVAVFAPIFLPHVNTQFSGDFSAVSQGPSSSHLLGTDSLGRDVLDRLLVGTRPTIFGAAEGLAVVLLLGVPFGLIAGYFGGRTDRVVRWLADLTFAMPAIIVILAVLAVFPDSMTAAMLAYGVIAAPGLMRIVRASVLPVREELYVAAARVSGLSHLYVITRHVFPRIRGPIIVQASLLGAGAILLQTALGFLGLVVKAPAPSWGGMVADGVTALTSQPWLIWPPGVAITVTILAIGTLGDMVRDTTVETWTPPARRRRRSHRPTGTKSVDLPMPRSDDSETPLLAVENLSIAFASPGGGDVTVVEDISFDIRCGEALGLVGESGSGKTVTATAILGLVPGAGEIAAGRIMFNGADLTRLSERELERLRGKQIGLVSQEPMVSLTPVFRVGWQLCQAVRRHNPGLSRSEVRERAIQLLRRVHLPEPEQIMRRYPYELSGGMAQRVAIARAIAGNPKLLIADEPTTALDVTVQAEILDLLRELQQSQGMAILLVTHDWGVVADLCQRVAVMYAGQVVERADLDAIFNAPEHPYTEALMESNPYYATDENQLLPTIPGDVPRAGAWPTGCHFQARCKYATVDCRDRPIALQELQDGRETRCLHHDQLNPRQA